MASAQRTSSGGFVGREHEMAALRVAVDDALVGRGRLVLLAGEPGIGKTRTAEEAARYAERRGMQIAWGRGSDIEGTPGFWPWVQVLRDLLRSVEPEARDQLGPARGLLTHLLPELQEAQTLAPPAMDSPEARFQLLQAIVDVVAWCAQRRARVIILDDLHAADRPSLLALDFLARTIGSMPVLAIGTYRDVALDPGGALAQSLAGLIREPLVERIHLRGLAAADVSEMIRLYTGRTASVQVVENLHRITGGHPFFLSEVLRALTIEGRLNDLEVSGRQRLPALVRDAVGLHLAPLSAASRTVLRSAAVIGRDFSPDVLAIGIEVSAEEIAGILEEATKAGVVVADLHSPAPYSFTHELLRDVLYAELPQMERVRLHRRIGEALARRSDAPERLAQIAHHFVAGSVSSADATRAVDYTRRAADRALQMSAFEDAAHLYETAMATLDLHGVSDARLRAELAISLGDALNRAGELARAKEVFVRAAAAARHLSAPELLARAALGYGGGLSFPEAGSVDELHITLLDEALAGCGDAATEAHAQLLGRLAVALYFTNAAPRRQVLCDRALAIARQLGDMQLLAQTLSAAHTAKWGPNPQERLGIATELLQLAQRLASRRLAFAAHQWRLCDLIELDEAGAADTELAACVSLAAELRDPTSAGWAKVLRGMRTAMAGRFDEAERLATEVVQSGRWFGRGVDAIYIIQVFVLRMLQGRWDDVLGPVQAAVAINPGIPAMRSGLALTYAHLERVDEARMEVELLVDHLADLPWDVGMVVALAHLGQASAMIGDTQRTRVVYERLLAYDGLNVMFGNGTGYVGPVSYYLGIMAGALAQADTAAKHFEEALISTQRAGARPWLALTQCEYAAVLVERGQRAGAGRAAELLADARATAELLGMTGLEAKVRKLTTRLTPGVAGSVGIPQPVASPPPTSGTDTHPAPARGVFRREGTYWTITFADLIVRLKDMKALQYLAHLLRHPGQEFLALDLMLQVSERGHEVSGPPEPKARNQESGTGNGLVGLDGQAKRAYKERVQRLRDVIEEAERFNDADRAHKAQAEIDHITRELSAAVGLRGADRKAGSAAERARLTVTKRIKSGIQKINEVHPQLGRHLRSCVKTGYYCAYIPSRDRAIRWEFCFWYVLVTVGGYI